MQDVLRFSKVWAAWQEFQGHQHRGGECKGSLIAQHLTKTSDGVSTPGTPPVNLQTC